MIISLICQGTDAWLRATPLIVFADVQNKTYRAAIEVMAL
jgi:hypothetical protein